MNKKRKSIGKTLLIGSASFILMICLFMGALGFQTYYNGTIDKYQTYLRDALQLAMTSFDGDDLQKCIETKTKSDSFEEAQVFLNTMKENYDIEYIYVIKPLNTNETDNIMDVMAGITAEEKATDIEFYSVTLGRLTGTDYSAEVAGRYLDAMNTDGVSYFTNKTEFGYDYTGVMPIKNKAGNPVSVLAIDISMNEIQNVFFKYLTLLLLEIVVISTVALSILYSWLQRRVVKPIKSLENTSVSFVESYKNTDDPNQLKFIDPEISTNDEMEVLSIALTDTFASMKKYMTDLLAVTKEKERIGAELNVAKNIQADMLPRIFPAFPDRDEFDIFASMDPAKEVGGDFYDFFLIDDKHIGLVMADVSGKGVPAALFMVISKTLIKNRAMMGGTPSEILEDVNNQLCEGNEAELFVTVWFAILDITTGKGIAANAGHEHPALRRKDGSFELIVYPHSPIVGTMEGMRFKQHEFELNPGDTVFVYTDGVPEATNAEKELYGTDRMLEALNSNPEAGVNELLHNVRASVDRFVDEADQFDDLTMLAFEFKGLDNKD